MKVELPFAENVLTQLGITAAASALGAGIQKIYIYIWISNNNINNF